MERQNFVFYLFPGSVHVYFTAHSDRHKDRHGGLVQTRETQEAV